MLVAERDRDALTRPAQEETSMQPTAEQAAALAAFIDGKNIVLEAGAGTGKTTTLRLLADNTERHGLYVAYNKSIADEAAGKFPSNVECRTAHSYAYREVGHKYRSRLNSPRIPIWDVAKFLRINTDLDYGDRVLTKNTQARLVMETVEHFCRSADREISERHVPHVEGFDKTQQHALRRKLAPLALKAWEELTNPSSGALQFKHDHYLKLWQLSGPVLDVDFILFDEAQDANPVIDSIVAVQDCQKVYVGDRAQAIYGWNGAVDAMAKFNAEAHLYLSESWRFGQGIADAGNFWLERLDTPLRITGNGPESEVRECFDASAVLCRTNAGALDVVLGNIGVRKVHLVGGASGIERFVKGAHDLKVKGKSTHPDLCAFTSWQGVQDYVANDPGGADLQTMVRLVDAHGTETLLDALARCTDEKGADVVVSTAHKSKGREWDSVRIAGDFEPKKRKGEEEPPPLTEADIMLRYVAVTRAKRVLDPGPLPVPVTA